MIKVYWLGEIVKLSYLDLLLIILIGFCIYQIGWLRARDYVVRKFNNVEK